MRLVGVRRWSALLFAVLTVTACAVIPGVGSGEASDPPLPPVRVGTGPDPESRLLAHVMAELLRAVEIPAEVVGFADTSDARQALELGAVDVRPGYTGEAWLEVLGRADPPGDPRTSFARVQDFDERNGIRWMRPRLRPESQGTDLPPANATFAFFVQGPPGVDADLRTMSQLATRLAEQPEAEVCVDEEFGRRHDGLQSVWEAYRVALDREVFAAGPADAVQLVAAGFCIAGLTTATDGRAWLQGLRPLVDDLQVFPAFVVVPQYRDAVREDRPGLVPALGPMPANLSTAMLGRWNASIVAGESVERVATAAAQELLMLADRVEPAPESDAVG